MKSVPEVSVLFPDLTVADGSFLEPSYPNVLAEREAVKFAMSAGTIEKVFDAEPV